jgi:hypothetical protein
MENQILHLEYDLTHPNFRRVWFDEFKKTLPNIIAFWGTAILLSLVLLSVFKGETFFIFLTFTFIAIPTFIILQNYRGYISHGRQILALIPQNERQVILTFSQDDDGFDCIFGKNFSHIAWESIQSVNEKEDFFVFKLVTSYLYIPKTAFRNESESNFLRQIISINIGKNVKLLE